MNRHLRSILHGALTVSVLFATPVPAASEPDRQVKAIDWTSRIEALGGTPPVHTPIKFGAGTISRPDRYEYGTTFSPDGKHFFFGVDLDHRAEIRVSRWRDDRWSESETFLAGDTTSYNDPMMSADGKRLYFITDQESGDGRFDIAYVERTDDGWSGVRVASGLSTAANEYFWSESASGEQFFARDIAEPGSRPNFDIFHQDPATPGKGVVLPDSVNSAYYEGDPFVSADGNALVFVSNRPEGAGRGDLYVSHRSPGDSWQAAVHLDARINTSGHELTPYVTPDGRWLLFSQDGDIHWVSATRLEAFHKGSSRDKHASTQPNHP